MRAGKRIRTPPKVVLGDLTPNNIGTLKKLNLSLLPVGYSDKFYKDALDVELTPNDYAKLVFYQDLPVGNIVCRVEQTPTTDAEPSSSISKPNETGAQAETVEAKLYIMTLGVLAPYRRQGLARKLVEQVVSASESSHKAPVVEEASKPAAKKEEPAPVDKKQKKGNVKKDDEKDKSKEKEKEAVKKKARVVVKKLYVHVHTGNEDAKAFWEKMGFEVKETIPDYYRKIEPRSAWLLEREIQPSA